MADENGYPDLFADSVNIQAGPYGVSLTLYASPLTTTPPEEGQPVDLGRVVGRVRLAPELVEDLIPLLTGAMEAHRNAMEAHRNAIMAQAAELGKKK